MTSTEPRTEQANEKVSLPTLTAMELGRRAADALIRAHLQDHGEMPRALVIDIWGSATLRSGTPPDGEKYLECVRRRATR